MTETKLLEVLKLVEQLTPQEREALISQLQQLSKERKLTKAERRASLEAAIRHDSVLHEPSPRREDWYGDDGR
jgi:hypothetical protein